MKYIVKFVKKWEYEIEADNEDEAIDIAEEYFKSDDHTWDELIVEDEDGEELCSGYIK